MFMPLKSRPAPANMPFTCCVVSAAMLSRYGLRPLFAPHFVAVSDAAQATLQILVALRQHSGLRICAAAVQQIARQIGELAGELTSVGRVLLDLVGEPVSAPSIRYCQDPAKLA